MKDELPRSVYLFLYSVSKIVRVYFCIQGVLYVKVSFKRGWEGEEALPHIYIYTAILKIRIT